MYPVKRHCFSNTVLLIFSHCSNMTSIFAGTMWKWMNWTKAQSPNVAIDHENSHLSIRPWATSIKWVPGNVLGVKVASVILTTLPNKCRCTYKTWGQHHILNLPKVEKGSQFVFSSPSPFSSAAHLRMLKWFQSHAWSMWGICHC